MTFEKKMPRILAIMGLFGMVPLSLLAIALAMRDKVDEEGSEERRIADTTIKIATIGIVISVLLSIVWILQK